MLANSLSPLTDIDINRIYNSLQEDDWKFFQNKRLFITGGSGFIGRWLIFALIEANQRMSLNCEITILSRNPNKIDFLIQKINEKNNNLKYIKGDIRSFEFPREKFDVIVHGATDVTEKKSPFEVFSTCVDGTKRVLDFAHFSGAQDYIMMSSGAVYGRHPNQLLGVSESYCGGPDPTLLSSAYAEGKRAAEWLSCSAGAHTGLKVKIARIYAQVGPYMPLNKHFAIGNFIKDALANQEIIIQGDGTPIRSYLYIADTVTWILAMLVRGQPGRAWNVGGQECISILGLAERVRTLLNSNKDIKILTARDSNAPVECYVPDVSRAFTELKLPFSLSLNEAILRTAVWASKQKFVN